MDKKIKNKIKRLEIIDKILIIFTVIIGIITVIDIFIPDPIFLLDEAALASITGLLTYISTIIRKKIDSLKENKELKIDSKELVSKVSETAVSIKKSRDK